MSLLVGVAAALLSLGFWSAARGSSEHADRLWAGAWCSALATGALLLFAPPAAEPLVGLLGPVFPACQLAGAYAFARGRAPGWIVSLALALGLLRFASIAWGFQGLVLWIPLGVEPAGTLAAAVLLHRTSGRMDAPWTLSLLPALLVIAAFVDFLSALGGVPGTGVSLPIAVLWATLIVVGLPIQMHVAVNRDRHRLANLHYRIEAELQGSQQRFRALSESAFDLVAELDGDERLTYVNPRYQELLGYGREELLGRSPIEFVHPDDAAAARRFADEADVSNAASELVLRARRSDGSYVWLENVARSFVAPDGRRRWVMNSRDVSDRMVREELRELDHARLAKSAAESEERFRALTEQAPELISEFDERGRYTFANESFRELLGLDPKTLIGTTPEDLMHPDDLPASRAGMIAAFRDQGTTRALHRLRHADGSWRWFENTGRAYRNGDVLRFVSIGRDVTEARRQEEERRELEHRMREVQRLDSLGALAGGIAHDFNNLLAVILGNVNLLESEDLDDEASERLRRIRSAAAHAEELADQMLTYAGKSVSDLAPIDLSRLVSQTEDLLRATVADRGRLEVELELDLAEDLPCVHGDATQLRQVLLNLVANASEAIAEGARGRSVRVRTALRELTTAELADCFGAAERPAGPWVLLEVTDDGPGMYAALRTRIFEPFFTTRSSGRGLGLSAVLGIASAHGGVLCVDSTPGRGTTFRVLLRPSGEQTRLPSECPASRSPAERDARLLVVDDDEAVREVAQILLERGGFQVQTAAGGEEALSLLRGGAAVDAVLLDLEMPTLSGADLLEQLRRLRPELPIVVASGYKRELAADRLGRQERFGFVQKPFDPEALLAAMDDALAGA